MKEKVDTKHACDICRERYSSMLDLRIHGALHVGTKPFICVHCYAEFEEISYVEQHIVDHTGQKNIDGYVKDEAFQTEGNTNASTKQGVYICDENETMFASNETDCLQEIPISSSSLNDSQYVCDGDKSKFAYKEVKCSQEIPLLTGHKNASSEEILLSSENTSASSKDSQYVCDGDDSTVSGHRPDRSQEGTVSSGYPFQCPFCEKQFSRSGQLMLHQWYTKEGQSISDNSPTSGQSSTIPVYGCDSCEERFQSRQRLFQHQAEHKYDCDVCGKKIANQATLNRHMFIHTGVKPYICDLCKQQFIIKRDLRNHMLHIHNSDKQNAYKSIAPKGPVPLSNIMPNKVERNKIRRKIFGVQPINCDFCNSQFKSMRSFNIHKSIHRKSMPNYNRKILPKAS